MIIFIYSALCIYFIFGAWAFSRILKSKTASERKAGWIKYWVYLFLVVVLSGGLFLVPGYFLPFSLIIILIGYYEIIKVFNKRPKGRISHARLILVLMAFTLLSAGFISFSIQPKEILIVTFLTVTSLDAFSQITGQLFGRHPILPGISPNKTAEGLAGGIVMGTMTSFCLRSLLEFAAGKAILMGLLITGTAFAGDILASWYKRQYGVKDFSNLIPGHGGILDRFDSLISSGAMVGFILYIENGL